ncbi:MAG TPA: serine/threonine-protein kinase [Thermoanaerobaculia bacterium]|nr:serine/threonine-protein kinase [Thermoanaerobaculia bacterium]
MPSRRRWQRVKELLAAALERPPAERESFLGSACAGDSALRREVDDLLTAQVAAGPLEEPVVTVDDPPFRAMAAAWEVGRRLGGWRVVRSAGEGGMGAVYLVERRQQGAAQRGALKLVPPGADLPELAAALERELRILARLDHPGVARLLDGGRTPEGRPYVVVEWVEGDPLDAHCRSRRHGTASRVRLGWRLCTVVAHLHHDHVVHGDLKPDNVLVDGGGALKLVDFGSARSLADGAGSTATLPYTVAFASPERVARQPPAPASDVFALAVLLYRLLAGSGPVTAGAATVAPSAAVRGRSWTREELLRHGVSDAGELAGELAGALDELVLAALAPEPARRPSADELASRLEGWLAAR